MDASMRFCFLINNEFVRGFLRTINHLINSMFEKLTCVSIFRIAKNQKVDLVAFLLILLSASYNGKVFF